MMPERQKSSLDEKRSSGDKKKSGADKKRSRVDEKRSSGDEKRSRVDEKRSSGDEKRSSGDEKRSSGDEKKSGADKKRSRVDEKRSGGDEKRSRVDEKRSSGDEKRSSGDKKRSSGDEKRSRVDEKRSSGDEKRSRVDEKRSSGDEKRSSGDEKRSSGDEKRSSGDEKKSGADKKRSRVDEKRSGADEKSSGADEKRSGVDEKKSGGDEKRSSGDNKRSSGDNKRSSNRSSLNKEIKEQFKNAREYFHSKKEEEQRRREEERRRREEERRRREEERRRREEERRRREEEQQQFPEIEKKFSDLLCEYQIIEEDPEETLAGRMKTLQNELMVEYCEGKSCILAMLAVIHAIRGVKVDIVTSSPVLACRDLEEWSKLYNMFDITSSAVPPMLNDVSSEEQDKLTQEAYKQDVVYSTVGTFAADTLKQEFEKKTSRGDRKFELVLVDEVDYMTLDNGVQITFLSHESSGLQHLEQVLASIWAIISACRPIEVEETGETMWTTRVQNFHTAALIAMIGSDTNDTFSPLEILMPGIELGFYSEEDFESLKVSINEEGEKEHGAIENEALKTIMAKTGIEQQYDLLKVLEMGMEHKVAFNCYIYQSETRKAFQFEERKTKTDQNINMLLLENGKACEILSEKLLMKATISKVKSKIKYSKECNSEEDKESLVIPSFLEKYLDNQLPLFVENALKAIQMTKGREYMIERSLSAQGIDVDEDDEHMYHAIIPVDFQASGMLEKRKRWGDGLQQFLEMKHQLTLSPLSNATNYMSNSNFFKRYLRGKGIFGVSGTLGGDADKGFLARHYKTDSYVIPAHQRQKVTELPAVQVRGGTEQWIQTICATVTRVSKRGQVVLVVCEDVNTANALNNEIAAETKHLVTMYTMSESHNIENQEFNKGQIIITTNLGGRGTDIKVTEEVNRCGGLFVLLTYFPNNRSVEKQVFGRTGRKGTPGMVQVILNHDRLAMAYRGHSIEVMRELREEYEINRIKNMEKQKLVEIEMKEELFSTFCQFLTDFDRHYSTREKTDLFEVKVKDVPCYFTSFHSKMDYHPALNALKESWGIWLILHTDQINVHKDLTELKEDLIQHLQDKSNKLLQGHSENLYDHIQQALGRTALHLQNKNKCDYGAETYWKKVSESDNYYRAAALYNQAYITINMARGGYKSEACSLLKEAEKAIDVYISETTRTLSFCSLSVTPDFEPHHSGSCNFQTQMQARMNIFNSWKENIRKILDMLGSGSGDFRTEELTLYSLSTEEDFVSSSELGLFRNYGLAVVFEVKQKPKFSFDALICCFLGVIQVVAGVLICGLSAGSMSSFGLGLISEGVSDMISGVMGMINGTFDWASWAISKAMSIGISLACGGFRVLKQSFSSVKNAASNILNGTKSLKSVASSAFR
ncbi:hypothetical protein KOW79_006913 [Hemibagrus wyckioides]|uniref:Protein translocase subunit SecA n=1 Tax=Hemibagrus wyckioides TaxID=337641 RepID=A0A9D3NY63_9TELE|nr:hypothetical protein KOW79_006913 [Hemibagrus wyckioides]